MSLPTDYKPKVGLSFIFRLPLLILWVYHIDVSHLERVVTVTRFLFVLSPPTGNKNFTVSTGGERIKN